MTHNHNPQDELMAYWQAAIQAVNGQSCVTQYFSHQPYHHTNTYIIALGKAASAMTLGAINSLGDNVKQAIVFTKYNHSEPALLNHPNVHVLESGHPIPDANSLKSGKAMLDFVKQIPTDAKLLLLISGGASALVEVLPEGFSLASLQALNQELLASGKSINEINLLRKAISTIKGGKFAQMLNGLPTLALMISDVPGDDPSVIGSGLVSPWKNSHRIEALKQDHPELAHIIHAGPKQEFSGFSAIKSHILASNAMACKAVSRLASSKGHKVFYQGQTLHKEIHQTAHEIAQQLILGPPGVYIWGGESTAILPKDHGKGGRNQALALLLAQHVTGRHDIQLLAAGSDGTDGPTDAAGGMVDGRTISNGDKLGWVANDFIHNAYPYLKATGSLFKSGPTGTNVMDFVFAIKS